MKKTLLKDTFREIKKSLGRFLSIAAIITLGVAFFTGIKIASPNMQKTADKYFDENNLMDITVISNLGLSENDAEEILKIPGVEGVMPTFSKEVISNVNNTEMIIKVLPLLNEDITKNNKTYINKPTLVSGRYPEKPGECVVEDSTYMKKYIPIGSNLNIYGDNEENLSDSLKNSTYKVVGTVRTPYYIANQKGPSTIGDGNLSTFIMVPESDFKMKDYTEMFVTLSGVKKYNSYDEKYENKVSNIKKEIEKLGEKRGSLRYDEVIGTAKKEIENGKIELEKNKLNANKKLDEAKNALNKGKSDLKLGENELKKKQNEFKTSIKLGEEGIVNGEKILLENEKKLNDLSYEFYKNKPHIENEIKKGEEGIKKGEENISVIECQIIKVKESLQNPNLPNEEKENLTKELKNLEVTLNVTKKAVSEAKIKLNEGKAKLLNGETQIKEGKEKIQKGKNELIIQRSNLEKGKETAYSEFNAAKEKINSSKLALEKGENEYNSSKEKAQNEINNAEEKLNSGEEKLNEITEGKWYVLDRNANYGFVDFGNSTNSINSIAKIFPIFFFLVAALICLTTITRMVDEQRVNIGTMKALGYSKVSISSKYILYAALASLIGSILGCIIGFTVFPSVIFNAYSSMTYVLPEMSLRFDIPLAIIGVLTSILTTTLAAFFACNKELSETPALLMRPKPPKEGKRILLERIGFLWRRMSFTQKVTARNIFRYKKRFLMTVIGVAGCTALLLTGFGLKDSISSIVNNQYGKVFKYDATISYKKEVNGVNEDKNLLLENKDVKSIINVKEKSFNIIANDIQKSATIVVPEDSKEILNFINLENRITGEKSTIQDNSAIITEKLAKLLNVKKDDYIYVEDGNKNKLKLKVDGISENYVSHYIYITKSSYEKLFKEKIAYNKGLLKAKNNSKETEKSILKTAENIENITSVNFNSTSRKTFDDMISNLEYIVLLMIASAGALAFVVLYNLTNVNISERMREIATIKVLGFYDIEVAAYVFWENIVLSIFGTVFGLILGTALHRFIMVTAEMEFIMFGREISPISYIMAALLTIVFAILVNFAMYFKLKKIKMVESLKSVD